MQFVYDLNYDNDTSQLSEKAKILKMNHREARSNEFQTWDGFPKSSSLAATCIWKEICHLFIDLHSLHKEMNKYFKDKIAMISY